MYHTFLFLWMLFHDILGGCGSSLPQLQVNDEKQLEIPFKVLKLEGI